MEAGVVGTGVLNNIEKYRTATQKLHSGGRVRNLLAALKTFHDASLSGERVNYSVGDGLDNTAINVAVFNFPFYRYGLFRILPADSAGEQGCMMVIGKGVGENDKVTYGMAARTALELLAGHFGVELDGGFIEYRLLGEDERVSVAVPQGVYERDSSVRRMDEDWGLDSGILRVETGSGRLGCVKVARKKGTSWQL